jgi:trans-aconitate methyltransferase
MSERAGEIRRLLKYVQELDRDWQKAIPDADTDRHTPWMPMPVADYLVLLIEAITEAGDGDFLEIGCGIGTRMLLAREIFGLDVHGFDRVPDYIQQARTLGLQHAEVADAAHWTGYEKYAIVFFNRPFRNRAAQAELEARVWLEMAPGAVVIAANLEAPPPSSWFIVADDWESRRGAWQKPALPLADSGAARDTLGIG